MALSADEQRELAEIERRLATDDPGLATCLTAFRRPGPARVLRSPRARIIGSLCPRPLVPGGAPKGYTGATPTRLTRTTSPRDMADRTPPHPSHFPLTLPVSL